MKLLAGFVSDGVTVRNSQGMARAISKAMELGNQYRLFLPVGKSDMGEVSVAAAAVPGRRCDWDALNISFIRLREFELNSAGKVVDHTGLTAYARMAKVFYDASYRAACAAKEREAKDTAALLSEDIDETALTQGLREIELQYYGDRTVDPVIYPSKNQLISGVVIEMATEGLLVPLGEKGVPMWGKAESVTLPVSNTKSTQLLSLLRNSDYFDDSRDFLEIQLDYQGKDKQSAGQALAYQGVTKDTMLSFKFPESWEANKATLGRLPENAEAIASRNMSMSSSTSVADVVSAFEKYISKHKIILANIDVEDDNTKRCVDSLVELEAIKKAPKVYNELLELQKAVKAEKAEDDIEEVEEDEVNEDADMEVALNANTLEDIEASKYDTEQAGTFTKPASKDVKGRAEEKTNDDPFAELRQ